ncbi:ATP-binding cassette domain-containing protein [Neorhizobium galegae]|uniref:Oligopeptide ABC transporter, ATP-binding protein OppF n=1 Tax=Neorhizobium galegae bv. orientalis str. HAMBI 540 TaxID=1028800 RepID=A0A068T0I2_NEOGA|nr:ATP-binding cassette domain-containing protein [Neorhizobium galegae]MCQ1854591.1 ATP-binding cassette domain-containing protein [Neorhizobium galegae]CDN51947.1 Oligopeptide ABC transporter, ATP-binding protein OppF [Neorhizobium galegae bv. orientalis str. HAMBI 540]CDZ51529.1 Oligopeptide ABC transporter, ATP-binding protein [Neorhizobium galegae bv. orientalis]
MPEADMSAAKSANVLSVRNLTKHFGSVKALDDISFDIREGEILAVVGESGSGKSTLARAVLRLIDASGGEVLYRGSNIFGLPREEMRRMRQHMQMIFQDPYASLHPRRRVEDLISDPWRVHLNTVAKPQWEARVRELLSQVGLPESYAGYYPARLSGGERQRVAIARALALQPDFLILDEPVSALDVSIQAQVIKLLMGLQEKFGFTCMFISHDLALVRLIAHRVIVMYRGQIVEHGETERIFTAPAHDYTRLLLDSSPSLEGETVY